MNAAHRIGKLKNRLRRIGRSLVSVELERSNEMIRAEKSQREPVLGAINAAKRRLETRRDEITEFLARA